MGPWAPTRVCTHPECPVPGRKYMTVWWGDHRRKGKDFFLLFGQEAVHFSVLCGSVNYVAYTEHVKEDLPPSPCEISSPCSGCPPITAYSISPYSSVLNLFLLPLNSLITHHCEFFSIEFSLSYAKLASGYWEKWKDICFSSAFCT